MKPFNFSLIILSALFFSGCKQAKSQEPETGRIHVYKNLALFIIQGNDQTSREYCTLEEAMDQKHINLRETGNVGELTIDNPSGKYVFIMSGDIVKGGKQDRTIAEDVILKPQSKGVPLKSFCVEQSRWSPRGNESASTFSSSKQMLSNKVLKIAAREKKQQGAVWAEVSNFQEKAGKNINKDVKSSASASSLQLTLENEDLKLAVKEYVKEMEDFLADKKDVLGLGFYINGKLSTIDVFGNTSLFLKLKPKLIESAANEAVSEYDQDLVFDIPEIGEIDQLIADAEKGEEVSVRTGNTIEKKHKTDKCILFHTFDADESGKPVHSSLFSTEGINIEKPVVPNNRFFQNRNN